MFVSACAKIAKCITDTNILRVYMILIRFLLLLFCRLQFLCYHELKLPMYDPDGDQVKCRWAVGRECDSVCHALPSVSLDEVN